MGERSTPHPAFPLNAEKHPSPSRGEGDDCEFSEDSMTVASPSIPIPRTPNVRALKLAEAVFVPVAALVGSFLIFSLFLLVIGKSPIDFFSLVWTGGFGSRFSTPQSTQRRAAL